MARLNSHERLVLIALAFSCGGEERGSVSLLQSKSPSNDAATGQAGGGEILHTLVNSGFIFTLATGSIQYHYTIPNDLCSLLREIFADDINASLKSPKEAPRNAPP